VRRVVVIGELVMVGAEERLPYTRPPLSKELPAGRPGYDEVRDAVLADEKALGAPVAAR